MSGSNSHMVGVRLPNGAAGVCGCRMALPGCAAAKRLGDRCVFLWIRRSFAAPCRPLSSSVRSRASTREAAAAEALLGCRLEGLKVMRLEAQRARDVVDGEKTLELTGKHCHQRGVVLVGETAKGASAKGCAIGAVTLGECASLNRGSFDGRL